MIERTIKHNPEKKSPSSKDDMAFSDTEIKKKQCGNPNTDLISFKNNLAFSSSINFINFIYSNSGYIFRWQTVNKFGGSTNYFRVR